MIIKKKVVTPLFDSILREDWSNVGGRLQTNPHEAKVWTKVCLDGNNFSRLLPLHQASTQNSSPEILHSLIKAYPKALKLRDSTYSRLPLHYACYSMASNDVVKTLIKAYPEGVRKDASLGWLPLHYACSSGASKEVILELLSTFKRAAKWKDTCGRLPIHIACLKNAPSESIEVLLEAYPRSIFDKTEKKNTPLHCAQFHNSSGKDNSDTICLLEKWANQLKDERDQQGDLVSYDNSNMKAAKYSCYFVGAKISNAEYC